ncbi:hypothetical protein TMatcc_008053 [Talaromyces marneffei ATCC 18224]|uniref:15-hydroxyprostaglandin dehydrogenase (NAD(+)) n=1 Tax=Talaromyces marneffei (strain ATCC 18224 / CBS 334.59 / QM 7333) TaxID=441960 RepID=B6QEH8_TALMQ|nr:uncharacterized protein EYB26_004955 [Talaromyces marneffei]EEA24952.1 15-hydroxyprostaglandin dehydrogenase (NAD(+)) [Talaromyces marneffei ATCC 18224]KAE8552579.1 hypothetical protein EYB25_003957 [Talaromyces marneffei]QGA17284.1 hypothetical protein EYB26_004955 [Talaromyces marneffei]
MSQPVALITGAASGMGLALTEHLVAKGWRVVMADVNEESGTKVSKKFGDKVLFQAIDVRSYPQQARLFKAAFEWGGSRLDYFAANAGIADTQFLYSKTEQLDENGLLEPLRLDSLDVSLTAVIQGIWLYKHYVRQNKVPGGKVVVTSSSAGLYPMKSNPIYTAAKHALVGLVRALGPVFAKENIQVNAICPAFVPTALCPPHVLDKFPKEHITPMTTVIKAHDTFIKDGSLYGQTVELSLDQLYFRTQPEFPNESQRWLAEDSLGFWEEAYKDS